MKTQSIIPILHNSFRILILLISLHGFSQINIKEDILPINKAAELFQQPSGPTQGNLALITQVGTENLVWVQQLGSNKDLIKQIGISNVISIAQNVSGGQLSIEQYGKSNQYNGIVIGEHIELSILQSGESNTIFQHLLGNGLVADIVQDGVSNGIQYRSDGPASPIRIIQKGNDMKLIITQHH